MKKSPRTQKTPVRGSLAEQTTIQLGGGANQEQYIPSDSTCQQSESLEEKLDRLWTELETTQDDDRWIEVFQEWMTGHALLMGVNQ